jgi:hypothetical protein
MPKTPPKKNAYILINKYALTTQTDQIGRLLTFLLLSEVVFDLFLNLKITCKKPIDNKVKLGKYGGNEERRQTTLAFGSVSFAYY